MSIQRLRSLPPVQWSRAPATAGTAGTVCARVLDSGQPAASVEIWEVNTEQWPECRRTVYNATTGWLAVVGVPAGAYTWAIAREGGIPFIEVAVIVRPGHTTDLGTLDIAA